MREGSLVIEPRNSVINKEEVNADNWETNIGIVEGEGDGTMDLAQLRPTPEETHESVKLPADMEEVLTRSPERPPRLELTLKQSLIQSRLRNLARQTLISESRMVMKERMAYL